MAPHRIEIPRPSSFKGSWNAREVDYFLWNVERYFTASNIRDDAKKLKTTPFFLTDIALLWRRRREGDFERGALQMKTWDDFKAKFKSQFYPENAEFEARARLKQLVHNKTINEYLKELQESVLELPHLGKN